MSDTVDVVLKLKAPYNVNTQETLAILASYALEMLGEGGNPDATIIEDFIGFVNTPVLQDYLRCRVGKAYGMALEYIEDMGGSPYAELVRVEWPGLGPGVDIDPETGEEAPNGEWPEIYVEVPVYDENGVQTGTCQQAIGRIA